jgi:hypothetical protein
MVCSINHYIHTRMNVEKQKRMDINTVPKIGRYYCDLYFLLLCLYEK